MIGNDGLPAGAIDQDLPRHLFGLKIDDTLMSELGAQLLVDDLAIAQNPCRECRTCTLAVVPAAVAMPSGPRAAQATRSLAR